MFCPTSSSPYRFFYIAFLLSLLPSDFRVPPRGSIFLRAVLDRRSRTGPSANTLLLPPDSHLLRHRVHSVCFDPLRPVLALITFDFYLLRSPTPPFLDAHKATTTQPSR